MLLKCIKKVQVHVCNRHTQNVIEISVLEVSNLILLDIKTVEKASDWLIVNMICRTQSINKLSFQEALLIYKS